MSGISNSISPDETYRRNISWKGVVNELAEELAHEHAMEGGVSELLARLVIGARKLKRQLTPVTEESIQALISERRAAK